MTSTHRQIALQALEIQAAESRSGPSLGSLRLGLGLLFCGMMLTLSVTLSLAVQVPMRCDTPPLPMQMKTQIPILAEPVAESVVVTQSASS
ncbi:hypothetical protein HFP89_05880 [Wenzhouxiangella sp. XN79A]|uniref:hypothetical protein n=1 Tax=Wenzhouxiangella sp. XN79A TaxID=2724193 RepID=UPI00144ADE4B|nr:hypothetical protein [Wenzhouxiangella sp. XN79A]NKI34690.1 hypothetical protein [Wenzhouxiangella sp. XN79A]